MSDMRKELKDLLTPAPVVQASKKKKRTLGDIYSALEAQRVYFPDMPSVSKPIAAAPSAQQESGTAGALGTEGAWGGGNQRKK
jgi:hypothetical protein